MNRRTVGVLTAELSDSYQAAVWKGIASEARRGGERVVCFLGSRINSPDAQETAANAVYELAAPQNISGLIVITSAISTYAGRERVQRLFDTHGSVPMVSIGVPVSGAGSIVADGREALVDIVDHLVSVHKRSRFALVAGPQWHVESVQRKAAVLKRLEGHGIRLEDGMVVNGTFEPESGRDAVRSILESPKRPDALVCLNDRMALGVLEELQHQGVRVPEDISVTGFDNIEDCRYSTPPLSTVGQPLSLLGESAMAQIRDMMNGGTPEPVVHTCNAVFRESCGCEMPMTDRRDGKPETREQEESYARLVHSQMTALLRQGTPLPAWDTDIGSSAPRNPEDSPPFPPEPDSPGKQAAYNRILGEFRERTQGVRRLSDRARAAVLRQVGLLLSEAFEIPVLLNRLREGLRTIGFTEAYLVLFEDEGQESRSRLMIAGTAEDGYAESGDLFPGSRILPDGVFSDRGQDTWALVPLVFTSRALGYLLLPGDIPDGEIYEILALQLASSLQGAMLLEQVRNHEQSLEEEVSRRTEELVDANRALIEEIATRSRLEAEVVEISRKTMERIGQDLHDDLCQYLAGISMHMSVLENHLAESGSGLRPLAARVNKLLNESIDRTRDIARGLLPAGIRESGLMAALQALAKASGKSSGIPVSVLENPAADLLDSEVALDIYGIIQEALHNSLRHSNCRSVEIRLSETESPETGRCLVAEVNDNGKGFDGLPSEVGMGLKIMRYRAEKAGAELSFHPGTPGSTVRCTVPLSGGET